jgi:lipopolysaccharide transport system ATP-binding protein
MSDTVIRIENLGKKYVLGPSQAGHKYTALRDVVADRVKFWKQNITDRMHGKESFLKDEFWALNDISCEIERGDRIGIIGRNGAGKSTLLKILSRITEPTVGKVSIQGRVASLLEVGTGFHPELTGRENIYLNGAILGMAKAEIKKKFDEIVEFSEIEKFVDTPVKKYSSGMYVKLAFSVAAHLETDILIVDEVLAVGDAQFQKKCLGKMKDITHNEQKTILFVSHNMGIVQNLCTKGILLQKGMAIAQGSSKSIIDLYLKNSLSDSSASACWDSLETAPGNDYVKIKSIKICKSDGTVADQVFLEEELYLDVTYTNSKPGAILSLSFALFNSSEMHVLSSLSFQDASWYMKPYPSGEYKSRARIPGNFLNEDIYNFTVMIVENANQPVVTLERIVSVKMVDSGANRGQYFGPWNGVVRPILDWKTVQIQSEFD